MWCCRAHSEMSAKSAFIFLSIATRWDDDDVLARGRPLVASAVDKKGSNVVVSTRKTSKLQQARCRRVVALDLNSTASVVVLRFGNDLERPVGGIGMI